MSPTLDDVLYIELVALMVEDILEPPCRYVGHVPYVWFDESGRAICGACHPPASEAAAA
jgi:hypothetical protein